MKNKIIKDWKMDFLELVFYGLDTICDIYFNDKLIGSRKNMHRKICRVQDV